MIASFQHKGLRLFFEKDDSSKLQPHHVEKIRRILYRLDESVIIDDMNQIGWGLHQLTGRLKGFWSIKVDKNFRIIFKFEDGQALDIDYDNESATEILDKIMHAIEQTPEHNLLHDYDAKLKESKPQT